MSGGSFNYLCNQFEPEKLFEYDGELSRMAGLLTTLEHADAAGETEDVIAEIAAFRRRVTRRMNRLRDVWHAVEWWQSCDWGVDQVTDAVKTYRGLNDGSK